MTQEADFVPLLPPDLEVRNPDHVLVMVVTPAGMESNCTCGWTGRLWGHEAPVFVEHAKHLATLTG